jgi:hypothetical protein
VINKNHDPWRLAWGYQMFDALHLAFSPVDRHYFPFARHGDEFMISKVHTAGPRGMASHLNHDRHGLFLPKDAPRSGTVKFCSTRLMCPATTVFLLPVFAAIASPFRRLQDILGESALFADNPFAMSEQILFR